MLLLAACNFEEDLRNTTTQNGEVLIQASTQEECDDLEDLIGPNPSGPEYASILECNLNIGVKEDWVMNNCTPIDTYGPQLLCAPFNTIPPSQSFLDDIIDDVVENTDNCPPCTNPDPATGCKSIIFTVTYITDECNHSQDFWEVNISADIYCCD